LSKKTVSGLAGQPFDRLAEVKAVAEASDAVIVCLGLDATIEGEEGDTGNSFVGGDKTTLDFFECQTEALKAALQMGKPVVLVVNAGSAMNLSFADERCNAVLQAWYSGPFGGRALAKILFGEHSPCGKLPVTFYRSDADLPDFRDYSMANRTYRYFLGTPLYPFGYGMSYSKFEYSDLRLSKENLSAGEDLGVSVTVKNIGGVDADEIVQIYVKDMESDEILPNFSLCGFRHISLKKREEKILEFIVKAASLNVVNSKGERYIEKGAFTVYAGGCEPDERSAALTKNPPVRKVFNVV
jgi:beta-glucosidase